MIAAIADVERKSPLVVCSVCSALSCDKDLDEGQDGANATAGEVLSTANAPTILLTAFIIYFSSLMLFFCEGGYVGV